MSADLVPTLHEYMLWYEKLLQTCNENPLDSEIMLNIKSKVKASLLSRCQPTSLHFVAAFLIPPFKDLSFVKTDQKEQTIITVKSMLNDILKQQDKGNNESAERRSESSSPVSYNPQFKDFFRHMSFNTNHNRLEYILRKK